MLSCPRKPNMSGHCEQRFISHARLMSRSKQDLKNDIYTRAASIKLMMRPGLSEMNQLISQGGSMKPAPVKMAAA